MRRVLRPQLVLLAFLALSGVSGCMEPGVDDLSERQAERVAMNGMRDLARMLAEADAGHIRELDMTVEAPIRSGDGAPVAASLRAHMEWGQGGVSFRHIVLEDDRARYDTTIWCTPHYVYYDWDGEVYEERLVQDETRTSPCSFDRVHEAADLLAPFTPEGAEALPMPEVSVENGEVTAVFEHGEGERLVVRHDANGLVHSVTGIGNGGTFEAFAAYGPRFTLEPPQPTERLPAHVETTMARDPVSGAEVHEVVASWHRPVLADIEARWIARDPADGQEVVLVSFPLAGTSEDDGTFWFEDRDADGRVSVGDRYTFVPPVEEPPALVLRELVLYDLWADEAVNAPVPTVPLGLVVLAGLSLVAWRRSR